MASEGEGEVEDTLLPTSLVASVVGSSGSNETQEDMLALLNELVTRAVDVADAEQMEGGSTVSSDAEAISRAILEKLIAATEHNVELKAAYGEKCRLHNQYTLFRLIDIINDFEIDEATFEALTFRECLIVSKLILQPDDGSTVGGVHYEPQLVGGLCIDIQRVAGRQPCARLMEDYEEKFMRTIDAEGQYDHIAGGSECSAEAEPEPAPEPEAEGEEDSLSAQNRYGYSKLLVHTSAQLEVDGANGGSTVTSWIDRNCHTIEELRKEFIVEENENVNERTLYTALKRHWYYVKHTSSQENLMEKKLYSTRKACHYVSEGANFVLQRYLAIKQYYGKFELSCMYINGDLCRNIYECFGVEKDTFNGELIDCCRIKRTIIEECGLQHICMTVLSLHGRLLKQEWEGCNVVMMINPQVKIRDEKPSCIDEMNLGASWMNDMQMLSMYLDQKNKCLMDVKTYTADHPELRMLMADYVNQILLLRPPDIKSFTYDYFGSFVSNQLPRNDYFE